MSKLTILVTGSQGATGSYLVEQLAQKTSVGKIIRIARSGLALPASEKPGEVTYLGDLLDQDFCRKIFYENNIDVIIFCAAKWNGINEDPLVFNVNLNMFSNVLFAESSKPKHFIFLSSSAVYSENDFSDGVDLIKAPISTYGKSKYLSELLLKRKAHVDKFTYTICRPFHIMSAREPYCPGRSHVTTDFVHRYVDLNRDFDWSSFSDIPSIPFSWAPDLTDAIVQNIDNDGCMNETYNIGSKASFSVYDLALSIARTAHVFGLSEHETFKGQEPGKEKMNGFFTKLSSDGGSMPLRSLDEMVFMFLKERYGVIDG